MAKVDFQDDDPNQLAKQVADAAKVWRESGAAQAIKDMEAKNKLFGDMIKRDKILTDSMKRLTKLQEDLGVPSRLMEDAKKLLGPPVDVGLAPSIKTEALARIPENPVHETNRRLNDLVSEVAEQRTTQSELIAVMKGMVEVQTSTDTKTRWIVLLTALGLVLAIVLALLH